MPHPQCVDSIAEQVSCGKHPRVPDFPPSSMSMKIECVLLPGAAHTQAENARIVCQ